MAGLTPGDTITVTLTYPANIAAGGQYWKADDTWEEATSLLGDDDGDRVLTLTITDGGFGDGDGEVDGWIEDPGGIGVQTDVQTDTTPPVVTGSVVPPPNSAGWHSVHPRASRPSVRPNTNRKASCQS